MASTSTTSDKSTSAQRDRPRISGPRPSFATIVVGENNERFVVHESLLTYHSDFFRAALGGHFKEAQEKLVNLPDDDENIFEFFVHWLYYQRFPDAQKGDNKDLLDAWFWEEQVVDPDNWVLLHIFGDKYGVSKLKQQALDGLIELVLSSEQVCIPARDAVEKAFESLPENSPMCRLLVDIYVHYYDASQSSAIDNYSSLSFLRGVWTKHHNKYTERIEGEDTNDNVIPCDYHEHKPDGERANCEKARMRRQTAEILLEDAERIEMRIKRNEQ